MPAVTASPDIRRITWSYMVAILEDLEAGHTMSPQRCQDLASQLQGPHDLLGMLDSLFQLAVGLWCDAHDGDVAEAAEHARQLAVDMAGTPG